MTAKTRIGFIGIGAMGSRMAANLARAGYPLTVHDADHDKVGAFIQSHQARAAPSLADLGRSSDVLICMLPTGAVVRAAFLQEQDGALAKSLAAGSIVVDMTSSEPTGTRELSAGLAKRGVALIDAPVSGGITGAEQGRLVMMVGADDKAALERVRPALAVLGHRVFEVGGSGAGHAMKALNNYVSGTGFMAAVEALVIGRSFGLDPALMVDVMNESTGRNFATANTLRQEVITRAFATQFTLGLLSKDVKIAADLAEDIRVNAPLARASRDLMLRVRDIVGGDADHTAAVKYWERLNAMMVSPEQTGQE
ncbi:MAG: NAD(P)-dependent oxidoreductase [Xanthobacteraceae bacterium]|nr:NAD(P)-dependent oxidoreductase [Xanthobacteraceae bacterium]